MAPPANSLLDDGHEAVARGDYGQARRLFDEAAAQGCAEAYEGLARCAHHDADYPAAIAHYERAYAAYRNRRDDKSACRAALAIAYLSAVHGEHAVMAGWVARVRSLLDDTDDEPAARAWVELYLALYESDFNVREKTLRECVAVGLRCGDADLQFDAALLAWPAAGRVGAL